MRPLLIDASNIAYHVATLLSNYNAEEDADMADASLLYIHRRHWLTSGFPVVPIWCCDRKPYWRNDIEPEYKANRDHQTSLNISLVMERLRVLGFPRLAIEGFEADDLAAAVLKHKDYEHAYLLTSDSDWLGMVSDRITYLCPTYDPKVRGPVEAWAWLRSKHAALSARAREKYVVPPPHDFDPTEIWKFKAITGDPADNLPPGTPLCLIDLFEPFTSVPVDELAGQLGHTVFEEFYWDPAEAQEFNQELPDQPLNPIRIQADGGRRTFV